MNKLKYEDLQKLSREDKYDFLEEYNYIEKDNKSHICNIIAESNAFIKIIAFLIIAIPLWKIAFGLETLIQLIRPLYIVFILYVTVLGILFLIYFTVTIYNSINARQRIKKLQQKYFTFETKIKIRSKRK